MTTPCLILPLRTLEQAQKDRAQLQAAKFARARARVAAGQMPRCAWAGGHRYDLLKIENGMVIEVCMDCGGRPRTFPVGTSSRLAKVIEFPLSELDVLAGAGGMR